MINHKCIRLYKISIVILTYAVLAFVGLYFSYFLRFDGMTPKEYMLQFLTVVWGFVFIKVTCLMALGQSNVVLSYFSLVDLRSILIANAVSSSILFGSASVVCGGIPRGVMVLDFLLFTGGMGLTRALMRYWSERYRTDLFKRSDSISETRPIAVFGAGDVGARVVRELLAKPSLRWKPVAFFDDDPTKWGQRLHGVPIVGKPELLRGSPWRELFRKIIVAAPSATPSRVGEIARIAADLGMTSDTLPALDQVVDGKVRISQLRPVRIDDLLRRPTVPLDHTSIYTGLRGKVVAVTGAGGSIGSELCRQILRAAPHRLLLIERSEGHLFQIEQELLELGGGSTVVPLIADINDLVRIREIFLRHRVDSIFHAAAHKHVPMMEAQPAEAIRNNTLGTANLARLAHEFGIAKFVLISTDKAINPTNVMGASKRLAEVFLQSFQAANPGPTRFMAVRFGNVLGSSGSVVPTFQKQIAAGGPVTVTHPEVTRYFMTIPEAVGLVLQAGALGGGGEIFVLDMGDPVKIVDLARQMIELSGYRPDHDIEIQFVGLRPGEKMFEEISHFKEKLSETAHPKIFRFVSNPLPLYSLEKYFDCLLPKLCSAEPGDLKLLLREMVPEYQPFLR
jgi:FlaA1/EpsC-like NDP-sugar epimerase